MRALELPPRLRLIAGWVPEGAYLADVGTDHGYLPTWLRLQGKIRGAVASDLRPGPLERAKVAGSLYPEGRTVDGGWAAHSAAAAPVP